MDFTFGITTNGSNYNNLKCIIESIINLSIPKYQIIIIGGDNNYECYSNVVHIRYSENSNFIEISKKKNLIAPNALYENIVYLHDYIIFHNDWYDGFLKFGNDFKICMNKIKNLDNSRYRDWCLWHEDAPNFISKPNYLIPYDMSHLSKKMYISGAYWVAKKEFMLNNKLKESLNWGQGEDVEWSKRIRNITDFKMNMYSSVKLLKSKDRYFNETTDCENRNLLEI